jgi:hypothetical protein
VCFFFINDFCARSSGIAEWLLATPSVELVTKRATWHWVSSIDFVETEQECREFLEARGWATARPFMAWLQKKSCCDYRRTFV